RRAGRARRGHQPDIAEVGGRDSMGHRIGATLPRLTRGAQAGSAAQSAFALPLVPPLVPDTARSAGLGSPAGAALPSGTRRTVRCIRPSTRWSQARHLAYLSSGIVARSKITLRVTSTLLLLTRLKSSFALPNSPPATSPLGGRSANA